MTTPFPLNSSTQIAEKSILDAFNRQTYLGNGFILSTPISLASTAELVQFSIGNPSTNNKSLFFLMRRMSASALVTARYYLNPTITVAGTLALPVNLRPAYSTGSTATSRTIPTVSNNGTLITAIASASGQSIESDLLFVIDPGNTILVTAQAATGTPTAIIETIWYEL